MSEDSEGDDEDIPGDHLNPDDFLAADTVRESFDETAMDPILSANLFEVVLPFSYLGSGGGLGSPP